MKISVHGLRTSARDWESVRDLSKDQLPVLTPEQRTVATKMNISEEDYARSALAGQRTQEKLLAKTERIARLLQDKFTQRNPQAVVEQVALVTWDHKFEVEVSVGEKKIPLRVDEDVVDDLLEGGSAYAEQKLDRIVDLILVESVA